MRRYGLVPTVLLASLPAIAGETANTVPERPKVEYVRVKGEDCLQPIVRGTDATSKDYYRAADRWLEVEYPGRRVPFWQTELILDGSPLVEVVRHAATVDLGPTEVIKVCFDVHLKEYRGPHPPP